MDAMHSTPQRPSRPCNGIHALLHSVVCSSSPHTSLFLYLYHILLSSSEQSTSVPKRRANRTCTASVCILRKCRIEGRAGGLPPHWFGTQTERKLWVIRASWAERVAEIMRLEAWRWQYYGCRSDGRRRRTTRRASWLESDVVSICTCWRLREFWNRRCAGCPRFAGTCGERLVDTEDRRHEVQTTTIDW